MDSSLDCLENNVPTYDIRSSYTFWDSHLSRKGGVGSIDTGQPRIVFPRGTGPWQAPPPLTPGRCPWSIAVISPDPCRNSPGRSTSQAIFLAPLRSGLHRSLSSPSLTTVVTASDLRQTTSVLRCRRDTRMALGPCQCLHYAAQSCSMRCPQAEPDHPSDRAPPVPDDAGPP